ncbi:tetratricopeptide repeat protein [Patescibacteria group bacterium]|nr:tetratricopeptide repeat protein [Patescibacteria group bacterium]MBU4453146.1 tetratricopeptide repeat protein [Patescibacteria group bacterium]MCG2687355.1 tetratricopeptide repeat protein [Candidatus Parcubacteria bacterium]
MKKLPFILATIVIVVAGGYWIYNTTNPYRGLVTHMDVQSDPETVVTLQQQLSQALSSISASKQADQRPDLNLYEIAGLNAYYLGDLAQAREIYEEYFTYNSINPAAWSTYGNILYHMEDWVNAESAYRTALQLAPMEEFYRDLIQVVSRDESRTSEVEAILFEYIDTIGQTQWAMVQLGTWYAQDGQCQKALDHYNVALTIAKNEGGSVEAIEQDMDAIEQTCVEK